MARTLRSKQITSKDLREGDSSGYLKGLAMSARITVSDCELRHARNRLCTSSNGRTGYTSFCTASILDEAKLQCAQSLDGYRSRTQNVSRSLNNRRV